MKESLQNEQIKHRWRTRKKEPPKNKEKRNHRRTNEELTERE